VNATPPPYWETAKAALAAADPQMAELIARVPQEWLVGTGDPFLTLARAIVSQQISVKAADAIWARLAAHLGSVQPTTLMAADPTALRTIGLSRRKVEYLQDLATRMHDGRLNPARWPALDDDAVIAELVAVKGIGRWTAEMFLIFHLHRPDVLPLDDIGLQRGIAIHYNGGERLSRAAMVALAKRWAPWRTVATWYLWRSFDPQPVVY
jgi:DNA-3-methyladenine glycosylase II